MADMIRNDERLQRESWFHDQRFAGNLQVNLSKYYSITRPSDTAYQTQLLRHCPGKRILEYGCGPGSSAFFLAAAGAEVTGIDISTVAIRNAKKEARRRGLQIEFVVGNAEEMEIEDRSFDVVCGTGILHHLDLNKAYSEIQRVLCPDGEAVFIEPMGHNPFINAFRRSTPTMRTEDEHPLLVRDIERARRYFGEVRAEFFHLATLAAVPFRNTPVFASLVNSLHRFDRLLFAAVPYLRRHAWMTMLTVSKPLHTTTDVLQGKESRTSREKGLPNEAGVGIDP